MTKKYLLMVGCLLCIPTIGWGIPESGPNLPVYQIAPVIITATKFPTPYDYPGNYVEVITKKQLTDLGVRTLKDALNTSSTLSHFNSGGIERIYMQGLGAHQVKVLFNGIELRDPLDTQGAPFLETISMASIDRIEIPWEAL